MIGWLAGAGRRRLLLETLPLTPVWASSYARKVGNRPGGGYIRMGRSIDSAEAEIGFLGTAPDEAAMVAFCAGGDGFVIRRHNHSPIGPAYVENTIRAQQPQIVQSGVVVRRNGFIGALNRNPGTLDGPDCLGGSVSDLTACLVISETGGAYFDIAFNTAGGQAERVAGILPLAGAGTPYYFDCGSDGGTDRVVGGAAEPLGPLTLTALLNGASGKSIWINGVMVASNAVRSTAATNILRIGFLSTNVNHEEVVFGAPSATGLRAQVTSNQAKFYGKTVP